MHFSELEKMYFSELDNNIFPRIGQHISQNWIIMYFWKLDKNCISQNWKKMYFSELDNNIFHPTWRMSSAAEYIFVWINSWIKFYQINLISKFFVARNAPPMSYNILTCELNQKDISDWQKQIDVKSYEVNIIRNYKY